MAGALYNLLETEFLLRLPGFDDGGRGVCDDEGDR